MIFSTASFQKGAIDYAKKHKIALVKIYEGSQMYITKSCGPPPPLPSWVPPYVGYMVMPSGIEVNEEDTDYGREALIGEWTKNLLHDWLQD